MDKEKITKTLGAIAAAIGVYMFVTYYGKATPPTLSGAAFFLLGAAEYLR